MCRIFITWNNSQRTQNKEKENTNGNNFNYVQLRKINKLSSYTIHFTGMYEKQIRKYTIESVLTSHSKSCTSFL